MHATHPCPALLGLAAIALAGCGASAATVPMGASGSTGASAATAPMGAFGSTGGMLGTWSITAEFCASGVSDMGFGQQTVVWFAHGRGIGSPYKLNTGMVGGKPVLVSFETLRPFREMQLVPARCARFEVRHDLQPDGSLGADVELDCDTGDGGRVTASIHAPRCH